MSDFKVGDAVVCVDARPHPVYGNVPLRVGGIYRVSQIGGYGWCPLDSGIRVSGVSLVGVPPMGMGFYGGMRFRHLPKADPAFTEAMRALRPEKEGVA